MEAAVESASADVGLQRRKWRLLAYNRRLCADRRLAIPEIARSDWPRDLCSVVRSGVGVPSS